MIGRILNFKESDWSILKEMEAQAIDTYVSLSKTLGEATLNIDSLSCNMSLTFNL